MPCKCRNCFDLTLALNGSPVITEQGGEVIKITDTGADIDYPLSVVYRFNGIIEHGFYSRDGEYLPTLLDDLNGSPLPHLHMLDKDE